MTQQIRLAYSRSPEKPREPRQTMQLNGLPRRSPLKSSALMVKVELLAQRRSQHLHLVELVVDELLKSVQ